MPPEAFFSTTAQVLPALLIAFAVEAGVLLRDPLTGWQQRTRASFARTYRDMEDHPDPQEFERWIGGVLAGQAKALRGGLLFFSYLVLLLITFGEVAATLVLYFGRPDNWVTRIAGMVCVVAMACSTFIVAAAPVVRLQLETPFPLKEVLSRLGFFSTRVMGRAKTQAHWRRGEGHLVVAGVPAPRRHQAG